MSVANRTFMYPVFNIDPLTNQVCETCSYELSNQELDFINTELIDMELSTVDLFRIGDAFEFRPDLISQKFFGNYNFGWLIARHNEFLDMTFDFYTGREIEIPDLNEYFRFYNRFSRA